jgi:hypothetical protein
MTDSQGRSDLPDFEVGIDAEVEAALSSVAHPAARAEFRDELRHRFLSAGEPRVHVGPPGSVQDAERRRRIFLRVGGLLAAGFILAIGFILLEPSAPRWKVLEIAEGSVVKADGAVVPSDDPTALARTLQRAREIEVEKGDLVLQIDDLSLFDLAEGTRAAFVGFDRKASGTPFEVKAMSGRLRARTGPGFQGRTMKIAADLMDVTVVGTAFAVDYEPHGTCICCLHGDVRMSSKTTGPDAKVITPEHMCLIYRNEVRDPKTGAPPERHAIPLRALEVRAQGIWPATAPR